MAEILIVEDELSINELIRRNLGLTGHHCTQAFDGRSAVDLLENGSFDLVVLDIMLEDIVVSPYQVIVHATTPGEQRELTDDRREKLLSKDPDMTDAEMLELLGWSYEPCYTICFNQDGEMLYADTEMAGRAGFAVQGKEIKTLHVFIFDSLDDWTLMEQEGMNSSVADRAVITKELHVE